MVGDESPDKVDELLRASAFRAALLRPADFVHALLFGHAAAESESIFVFRHAAEMFAAAFEISRPRLSFDISPLTVVPLLFLRRRRI